MTLVSKTPNWSQVYSFFLGKCSCLQPVSWQFSHLDVDNDGHLSSHEMKDVENNGYEQCVKPFIESCDVNKDKVFTGEEWCCCFAEVCKYYLPLCRWLYEELHCFILVSLNKTPKANWAKSMAPCTLHRFICNFSTTLFINCQKSTCPNRSQRKTKGYPWWVRLLPVGPKSLHCS